MKTSWRALLVAAALTLAAGSAIAQTASPVQAPAAPAKGVPGSTVDIDTRGDGVIDYRVSYDRNGNVASEELDYDHDGVMDTFFFYKEGVLEHEEIATSGHGKVDLWIYLTPDGKYVQRYERDTNGDGKPDVVRTFGGG